MKRKKPLSRLLAVLLSLALTFGLTPITAAAVGDTFTQGDLTYTVISDPAGGSPGTVSVEATDRYNISGELIIPESVTNGGNAYTVTEIANEAFEGCSNLSGSLTIPGSVTLIENSAFNDCSGFDGNLTISDGVMTIGYSAFNGCSGFSGDLTIPASVTSIGDRAFIGCSGFSGDLTIPGSVTSIGSSAFGDCSGFSGDLTIPGSVTSIGNSAFYGCSGFTGTLAIMTATPTIGANAFSGCTNVIGIASSITDFTNVDTNAFSNLKGKPVTCAEENVSAHKTYGFTWVNGGAVGTSFTVGNLTYTILANTNTVSVKVAGNISGTLSIPASVNYNSKTFAVTEIADRAFAGCSDLTGDLVIPNSVTSIGNSAFSNCDGFNGTLTIQTATPTIGWDAFYGCTNITGIESSITSFTNVSGIAFSGLEDKPVTCSEENVPSHQTYGFTWINGGVEDNSFTIGDLTYTVLANTSTVNVKARDSLISGTLSIPASVNYGGREFTVTEISDYAFGSCSGLTGDLTIPASVTSIGDYAFSNCGGLTGSLKIPGSVTSIGTMAFVNCTGFNGTLTILAATPMIRANVFSGCTNITDIESSIANFTYVEDDAFPGLEDKPVTCAEANVQAHINYGFTWVNGGAEDNSFTVGNLTYTILANTSAVSVKATDRNSISGELTIPASVNYNGKTFTVTEIADEAFRNCRSLTGNLTIPGSVTSIGDFAFSGCINLTGNLTIPGSATSIGEGAFFSCTNFESLTPNEGLLTIGDHAFRACNGLGGDLTIPSSVTSIGELAFSECNSIDSLILKEGLRIIGDSAFINCSSLTGNLIIPGSVTSIGDYAFYDCTGLESLTLNEGLQTIGDNAFSNCSSLTGNLIIPGSVTSIGESAFYVCTGFTSLTLKEGLQTIGDYAFDSCINLTGNLIIPGSATSIGEGAFYSCTGFESLTLSEGLLTIGDRAFRACNGIGGELTIPGSVTSIGELAFSECDSIKSLTLKEGLLTIGDYAFESCSGLSGNLTIPGSVTGIGEAAFSDCSGFNGTLTILAATPTIGVDAFFGCTNIIGIASSITSFTYVDEDAFYGLNDKPVTCAAANVQAHENYGFTNVRAAGAPTAPQNLSATPGDTTVTLNWTAPPDNGDSPVTGYKVSSDGTNWLTLGNVTSYTFTGLTNNQQYMFYVKAYNIAGDGTAATVTATPFTIAQAALTGAVSITGAAKYGETLTADTDGLTTDPSGEDKGALSYQWKRGGNAIADANNATYTVTQADIGQTITVAVTAANCTGEVTSDPTAAIAKADGPAAPAAVTGSYTGDGTTFTYTVTPITGTEYSQDGITWQDGNVFTGFTTTSPATTFYARLKETATREAGAVGDTGAVNFVKLSNRAAPPLAYSVSDGDFSKTVTITIVTGAEYSFNDDNDAAYSQSNTYTSTDEENLTLYIRLAETATHNASPSSSVVINTAYQNQAAPAVFTLSYLSVNDETYTVTIPATEGAEYSFDGTNWDSDNVKTDCLPGETVTGYKRMAAQEGYNPSPAVSDSVTLPLFKVKTPTASPANRNFTSSVSVTLSSDTPDASIYYTTDGSEPTIAATLYSGEFTLSATTTIKALAVKAGMMDSDVLTVTFTKSSGSPSGDSDGGGGGGGSGSGGTATQPSNKEDESKKEGTTDNLQGIDPKATKPVQLKTEDGIQIIIQPGALSQWTNPVDFSVAAGTITTSPQAAANVVMLNPANYQRQFEVEGAPQGQAEFNAPVTLIFPIKVDELPEGVTPDQLAVYLWDAERQDWLKLGGVYNQANQTLSVNVWHFSTYAVMADTSPAPNRLAGYDRFVTANAIADQGWSSGADNVVLVNAYSFPDALAAGPLAYKLNAPILLTDAASLTPATQAQLQKLGAKKITLIGGTAVVSQAIQDALSAAYGEANVVRYSGIDRYATAAEIAKALGATGQAVIANGEDGLYTDALAVSSYAAYNGIPILFTEAAKLPEATAQALTDRNVKTTIVVGGAAVVPEAVYNQLPGVTRYAGYDCYETATAIATGLKLNLSRVYVVSGLNFPDALVAGNLASHTLAPIIMVDRALPTATGSFLNTNQGAVKGLTIVGGEGIITAAQEEAVRGALQK